MFLQVGDNPPLLLGLDPVPAAMLSWADVAPGQVRLQMLVLYTTHTEPLCFLLSTGLFYRRMHSVCVNMMWCVVVVLDSSLRWQPALIADAA